MQIPEAALTIHSAQVSSAAVELPGSLMEAAFDPASISERLIFRNFRHGDRFQPLGMKGQKKLKDLFIEKKVPLSVRAVLPLLVMGTEILWIPGCGRSELAKIGADTRTILRLKAVPLGD